MQITALLVLKCSPEGSDPVILANASDVSRFGFFQRPSVKEFIVFVARTVAKRTPPGERQSVQHEEYKVHAYNQNGLCVLGLMDDHYPVRSAFSLLNQVLEEYQKNFGDSWKTVQADKTEAWPYLNDALTKFQDPAEADKLLKIQRELDETKIILVSYLFPPYLKPFFSFFVLLLSLYHSDYCSKLIYWLDDNERVETIKPFQSCLNGEGKSNKEKF
ncbi:VAMP YKT61 [Olea europaea subsp. europaea]|uniref:VAMP YKT61 n=1 Tax=Olea europaea subsp. europaea TaxID=158383 RepID=A0A8S0TP15_OLEEU|nr:VAMP YKT61 [Olea europaea subsp. europaea]